MAWRWSPSSSAHWPTPPDYDCWNSCCTTSTPSPSASPTSDCPKGASPPTWDASPTAATCRYAARAATPTTPRPTHASQTSYSSPDHSPQTTPPHSPPACASHPAPDPQEQPVSGQAKPSHKPATRKRGIHDLKPSKAASRH